MLGFLMQEMRLTPQTVNLMKSQPDVIATSSSQLFFSFSEEEKHVFNEIMKLQRNFRRLVDAAATKTDRFLLLIKKAYVFDFAQVIHSSNKSNRSQRPPLRHALMIPRSSRLQFWTTFTRIQRPGRDFRPSYRMKDLLQAIRKLSVGFITWRRVLICVLSSTN